VKLAFIVLTSLVFTAETTMVPTLLYCLEAMRMTRFVCCCCLPVDNFVSGIRQKISCTVLYTTIASHCMYTNISSSFHFRVSCLELRSVHLTGLVSLYSLHILSSLLCISAFFVWKDSSPEWPMTLFLTIQLSFITIT